VSDAEPATPAQGGLRVYGQLLLSPRPGALISSAFIARLPGVMVPIGLMLIISALRGSYAQAGLVTAAFAVGSAVAAPWLGRLLDRHGPRRVIPLSALVSGGLLVALAAVVASAPTAQLVVLAALAGAAQPPISPALRVGLRGLFADSARRQAGYALDSVSVEAVYVVGPLCLSLLLGAGQQEVLLGAAVVLVAGSVAFALAMPPTERVPQEVSNPHGQRLSVLRGQAGRIIGVSAAIAVTFGVMDTAMAGAAGLVLGNQQQVGLLFAATAGGSVVGGLVFGSRGSRRTQHALLRVLLGCFAATLAVVALLTAVQGVWVWILLPCLFVCGLTIAPVMITVANVVDLSVPPGRLSEGQSLNGSATMGGMAAGTALTGLLLDIGGVAVSFAVGALVLAAALAAVGRGPRSPGARRPGRCCPTG
jgi:MFS family permease